MIQAAQKPSDNLLEDATIVIKNDRPVVDIDIKTGPGTGRPISAKDQEAILAGEDEKYLEGKSGGTVQPIYNKQWFVDLDENGTPTGTVKPEPPEDPDQPYVTVLLAKAPGPDDLKTSSGAPLTDQMNPEHSFYDAGLEARNPRPPPVAIDKDGNFRRPSPVTADAAYGSKAVTDKTAESEAEAKRKADQRQKDRDTAKAAAKLA